ncbi:alpha/beta fold hydrolase [Saccharothrix saharensis]|uniref:alpha/beta fold hydrolase n=1 Tax=Saccharothrix saharensis TaxID=571190 RepID=UPI0036C593BF
MAGGSDLPALVFLHEGLGCAATWGRFPDRVARATGREVLVYSRHGYGGSGPAETPRTPRYMHDEALDVLPELLDRLELHRPALIGHSDGASIALLHAAKHPVDRVVVIAPHAFVEAKTLAGIRRAVDLYTEGPLRSGLAKIHDDPDVTFAAWTGIWLSRAFRSWDIAAELTTVDAPVLMVQGDRDQYGTTAQLDAVERAVRGRTSRVEIADCGHQPHLEQPDEVLVVIEHFLRADVGVDDVSAAVR